MRRWMTARWFTLVGFAMFGVGIWLGLTLLDVQIRAIFETLTTEQVYTVIRSPSWDEERISFDLFQISMQDTWVTGVSMDADGGNIQQAIEEPKVLPPQPQADDQFVSPDGAHTVYVSGGIGDPRIRLDDREIAPGTDPAWSPDSTEIAFVNRDAEVRVYNVVQDQLRTIYPSLNLACPQPIVAPTARLTTLITNHLGHSLTISANASTTPPISITPRSQAITLSPHQRQTMTWELYASASNHYLLDVNITAGGFSTTQSCKFYVTPTLLGSLGLLGGHSLALALMVVGFLLVLPRILTRRRWWSKIIIMLPFLAIIAFEILLLANQISV